MSQRKAVTRKKAFAYRSANRAGKSRALTELVELTGWHRDYARLDHQPRSVGLVQGLSKWLAGISEISMGVIYLQ